MGLTLTTGGDDRAACNLILERGIAEGAHIPFSCLMERAVRLIRSPGDGFADRKWGQAGSEPGLSFFQ
jgi:hypothetical protein